MSAKFPRGGGGSKPILSHPSNIIFSELPFLKKNDRQLSVAEENIKYTKYWLTNLEKKEPAPELGPQINVHT